MFRKLFHMLPQVVQPAVRNVYEPYYDYRFYKIARNCNGMLSAKIYSKLYSYASDINAGNVLEIGSAHGAGTVSLALAIKESNGTSTVVGVEKGEGGSRSSYGTKEDNISILRENVQDYGVEAYVDFVDERLELETGLPPEVEDRAPFSLVFLDADGRLDRDFRLLYEHIFPGSIIVIDDYGPIRNYQESTERMPLGGGKHYRTLMYVDFLLNNGYINKYKLFDSTLVATKPPGSPDVSGLDDLRAIEEHLDADRKRHT